MKIGNYIFHLGEWDGVYMEDNFNRKIVSIIGYVDTPLMKTLIFFGLRISKVK
jgi:hypothetical protein